VLIDGELFLPATWFTPESAARRQAVGVPAERGFATKPEPGLQMIQRAQARGLPFEVLACDELYGRSRALRAALDARSIQYAAEVPSDTQVYVQCPRVGVPRRQRRRGKTSTRVKVLSRQAPHEVRALARSGLTTWQRVAVRHTERGELIAEFAVRPVWTLTETMQVRREWLVTRREDDGQLTYVLLNASEATPPTTLIERSCLRYFTERTYQDAKSELGWADLQARKYRAWEHHTALTAAATWFVAEVKLTWREAYARDPELARQFELDVLPALSTLVHRTRSMASRLRTQRFHEDSG
jgi:SRSO17 transposase